jgi:hypothetical protein
MPKDHLLVDWFPEGAEAEQVRADWFAEAYCEPCERVAQASGGNYLESRPLAGAYRLVLDGHSHAFCPMHLRSEEDLVVCP